MRNAIAGDYPVSVDAQPGEARAADSRFVTPTGEVVELPSVAGQTRGGLWAAIGRFDLFEPIGYRDMAEILSIWKDDLFLEAAIGPDRFSQIRILFSDPTDRRGSGDSVISQIGAWNFLLSDLIGDLVGRGNDDPFALAVRYSATTVSTFFVYFSATQTQYATSGPWDASVAKARTQTVKLR